MCNITIVRELDILLQLEYKYGTPERFRPAIEDVLNYLQTVITATIISTITIGFDYPHFSSSDPDTDLIFQGN